MDFELLGKIEDIETVAAGPSVRDRVWLRKLYGEGRWRKLKGVGKVKLPSGKIRLAELHWYEAHGIGRKRIKIKRYLDV